MYDGFSKIDGIVFPQFKVMLISWIQMLLNVCVVGANTDFGMWNSDTQQAGSSPSPPQESYLHLTSQFGWEHKTKGGLGWDRPTGEFCSFLKVALYPNACINYQPHLHLVVAIFYFLCRGQIERTFYGVSTWSCVNVCVVFLFFIVIGVFNLSVASFAQNLFLGSYLALCAAIKVGFA